MLTILLVGTLTGSLLSNLFPQVDPDVWQFAIISAHALITLLYLLVKGGEYRYIIVIGFILRLAMLLCNYYDLFPIPHNGMDTENFHQYSIMNAFHGGDYHYTHYNDFLTVLYRMAGYPARWLAQYVNVILGMGVIFAARKTAVFLGVPRRIERNALLIASLLPHLIILSAILLREMWIVCAIAYSAYYFVKWAATGKPLYAALSSACVLLGAYMHSGVILILAGYVMAFALLNLRTFRTNLSVGKLLIVAGAVIAVVTYTSFSEMFLDKFGNTESIDDVLEYTNMASIGGSAYLTWIRNDSAGQLLLYSPLLMLYFVFSPMVFAIRNISDILALLLNTSVFVWLLAVIFGKYFRYRRRDFFKAVTKYLIIAFVCGIFVMALGTKTSGVALRHRMKVIPVMIAAYLVIGTGADNLKNERIIKVEGHENCETITDD